MSQEDQDVVNSIQQGDIIEKIEIVGSTEKLLLQVKEVTRWNELLDEG